MVAEVESSNDCLKFPQNMPRKRKKRSLHRFEFRGSCQVEIHLKCKENHKSTRKCQWERSVKKTQLQTAQGVDQRILQWDQDRIGPQLADLLTFLLQRLRLKSRIFFEKSHGITPLR